MIMSLLIDALVPITVDSARYVVEVVEQDFQGIPKYIWDGIFAVLDVMVVGLLLAYVASKYQHRKEVEWKLRGNLLEKRIESYQRVCSLIYDLSNQHDPTETEQKEIDRLLEKPNVVIPIVKYADIYSSEQSFQSFRMRLEQLIAQEKLFLDYQTLLHLECMQFYFAQVADVIRGFVAGERNPANEFTSNQIDKHIEIGLKAFGIALNNDMSKWYGTTDQLLAEKMRCLEIKPRKYLLDRWWDEWTDNLLDWAISHDKKGGFFKFCIYLKIGRWDFFQRAKMVYLIFLGAHYMDRKVAIWEEKPEMVMKLIDDYYKLEKV